MALPSQKPWLWVRLSMALVVPASMLVLLIGIVIIVGYLADIDILYHPVAIWPGTYPLTAVCLIALALGVAGLRSSGGYARASLGFVIVVPLLLLVPAFLGVDQAPWTRWLVLEPGGISGVGSNTGLMLLLIAVGALLYRGGWANLAQFTGFIASSIPVIALTGYAYGLNNFYGEMSPYSALAGLLLAAGLMAATANVGAINAILSPYYGGRIFRVQWLVGYWFPTLLGYFIINSYNLHDTKVFGVFVVCITWFILVLVSVSAFVLERADHARRVIERSLADAAMNDQLTGLANRRKFFQFGEHEIARSRRTGNRPWLLMLDLDRFKNINDTAGHEMGDRVLVAVSRVLKNSVRAVDLVSRLGGEEFAVLLVDTSREGACRAAESIRANVEQLQLAGWTDQHGPVTVSIGGCAVLADDGLDHALKGADSLLYQAKQQGRNRVVFSPD